MAQLEERN